MAEGEMTRVRIGEYGDSEVVKSVYGTFWEQLMR